MPLPAALVESTITVRDAYLGMKKTAQLGGGFHSSFPDAMRR
jgi:hypothetical protein